MPLRAVHLEAQLFKLASLRHIKPVGFRVFKTF
jgi:hypothetical protein